MRFSETGKYIFFLHFEWMALAAALLLMISINPSETSVSFCLLDKLGFNFCPGEGFGRSVASFFRGDAEASFAYHPAGIPAVFIMMHRIIRILNRNRKLTEEL